MPRTNLNDIQIFMAVVDAGSFAAGAQAMGLSRSGIAKAIARLEERLGTRLVNRTTRAISLTDEGRRFHERGRQILDIVEEAEESIAGPGAAPRGVLRLTVPNALGRLVILPLLTKFLADWPEMQVEVSFTDRLTDIVEEGFDLAVRIAITTSDTRLVSRSIARYKAVYCAAPSYVARNGEPRDIDDIERHECIVFTSRNNRQSWRFRRAGEPWTRVQGRSRLRLDNGEAIRDAAIAGLGIALLPDFMVADDFAAGRLCQILPDVETDEVQVAAIYPNKRLLEPRVRRFIDLMVAELGRRNA